MREGVGAVCDRLEIEECYVRIKALSKALEKANADRVGQMFRLAALGDKKALEQFEAFINGAEYP